MSQQLREAYQEMYGGDKDKDGIDEEKGDSDGDDDEDEVVQLSQLTYCCHCGGRKRGRRKTDLCVKCDPYTTVVEIE